MRALEELTSERAAGTNAAAFLESKKNAMIPPFFERLDVNGANIYQFVEKIVSSVNTQ
jgi:hypothetical protein